MRKLISLITKSTNRNHLNTVWGNSPKVAIDIPEVIDDYNHWMLGVNKADQYISYYRPNVRCVRTWMPLFLHCLDIIRANSYHKQPELPVYRLNGKREEHKVVMAKDTLCCTYCSYEAAVAKLAGEPAPAISRVQRQCLACGDRICKSHWNVFHGWND